VDIIKSQKKPIANAVNYVKNPKREKSQRGGEKFHYINGDYNRVF